ncbi:MAG: YqgE/AlgH family protein [Deltaproteobacteria bacterium]|nr:YqgE/AlgH family protein [Deltaproteobacteria bacterium]MBZ0220272.1 YqgE/AlgH family protein [Deltaproteobacteria bacterium]
MKLYALRMSLLALLMWGIALPSIHAHIVPEESERLDPETYRHDYRLAKGKFLVAGADLNDPVFKKTVILLFEYGSHGAAGLILNRPLKMKLADGVLGVAESRKDDPLFFGGPVEPGNVWMLFRTEGEMEGCGPVLPGVCVSTSEANLRKGMEAGMPSDSFRIYAGYAGWAPDQLERELLQGGWHVMDAGPDAIFALDPVKVWDDLLPG